MKSLFLGLFYSFLVILVVGCGGGGEKSKNVNKTISGIISINNPIKNATVKVYRPDGTYLGSTTSTDSSGKFTINFSDNSDIFIIRATEGTIDGEQFKGNLFSVCTSSRCNITPLSTIGYSYFASLLENDYSGRYNKMLSDFKNILGITKEEISSVGTYQNFDIDKYKNVARSIGYNTLNARILTDISDSYLDDYKTLFPNSNQRIARFITADYEKIDDENGNSIILSVVGVDGSQTTQGYLVDTMATRKITIVNEDYKEIEEDEVVYLGFNLGKWKDILNSETTVLAKLFMSDLDLLLLPNSAKLELVSELKSKYGESYNKTVELYKFIIQNGKFYEPIFDKHFNQLTGNAQNILLKINKNKRSRLRELQAAQKIVQHNSLLADSYKKVQRDKQLRDYTINGNLSIDYDQQNHNFKIKNSLPIYYGLRESKSSYTTAELFTSPLINPSELGAAGLLIKDSDLLTAVFKYTLNMDAIESTTLAGDQFDITMFPYVGSNPVDGKKEYEFYKEFAFNMPTILNVSLGMKAVIELASGAAGGKFKKIMDNLSDKAQNAKKYLKTLEDGLELAESLTELIHVSIDTGVKENYIYSSQQSIFFKNMTRDIRASKNIVSSVKNYIPPSPQNVIAKDKAGLFLTKVNVSEANNKVLKNGAILEVLNQNNSKFITNKQALKIIVNGVIIGNILEGFKIDSIAYTKKGKELKEQIQNFEKGYRVKLKDFSIYYIYKYILTTDLFENEITNFFKSISGLKYIDKSIINLANKDFSHILLKSIINNPDVWKDIIVNTIETFLKPVDIAKILTKVERMSVNDIIKTSTEFIIDESIKIAGSSFKSYLSNAVKQVAYMFTGTKAIQAASAANEIVGIGYGIACTPSVVPFAVKVNGGNVSFDYPNIKVLAAKNSIVPIGAKEWNSEDDDEADYISKSSSVFMFQPQKSNDNSALIITSQDDYQAFYDLSYKIIFNNSVSTLKGIYNRWDTLDAIKAQLSIRRYVNDDLSKEAITFGTKANEATWKISADEAKDAIKAFENGCVIDIIDILKKQNATGLKSWLGMSDESSTVVQNRTRGIFQEKFQYKIYEPSASKLTGKHTQIDYFDRHIFKIANAKEMRKGLVLSSSDNDFNIITNLTGHKIIIITWGFERELLDGESAKILKNENLQIVDSIVSEYGKNIGLKSTEATIQYLIGLKSINYEVSAASALQSEPYKFIINAKSSDFNDQKPNISNDPVNSGDYDGDGLSDYDELNIYYTNPYNPDSDGDSLTDFQEINNYHTQPYNADSDGDGLSDWQEINTYSLDPNKVDTDGDGINDLLDIINFIAPVVVKNTISGTVTTSDGIPLANITVKFEYIKDGENAIKSEITMPDGTYKIELSKEDFDNFKDDSKLIITAFGDGFVPETREITKKNQVNFYEDFVLEPIKENEIILEIEPKLHHLGDGHYTGSANSDFQKAGAEGIDFNKTFYIDWNQYNNYQKAEITFEAKGVQNYYNKLYLNDTSFILLSSPVDGSYETQRFMVDKSVYFEGENKLRIASGYSTDYDDFEFINIKITFLDPVDSENRDPIVVDPLLLDRNNTKEVVTDMGNRLMWQDNISVATNTYTLDGAVAYCENLIFAGFDDWRLAKLSELTGLVDSNRQNPAIFDTFKYCANEKYWTVSVLPGVDGWHIDMGSGFVLLDFDTSQYFYARCVRDNIE